MRQGRLQLGLRPRAHARLLRVVLALVLIGAAPPLAAGCRRNQVPVADLAAPALLSGPLHRLAPCAEIVGHMARFTLDTPFGPIAAQSRELLLVRIEELDAIEALRRQTRTGVALAAAWLQGAEATTDSGRVITNPVQTLAGIPHGAMRFFQRRVEKYAARAHKLGARVADVATDRHRAYDGASVRPGVAMPEAARRPWWQRAARETARFVRGELGYGATRRELARHLEVDPYSSNPILDARLDELAWAALAGKQAGDAALGAIGGRGAALLSGSRRLNDWVWELEPDAIAERNRRRLAALGCGDVELARWLRQGAFTPSLQTALADALVELQPARGCTDLLELAAALSSEIEARYVVRAVELLVAWRGAHGGDALLDLAGSAPILRPAEDHVVLPLAVDRLEWDHATRRFFTARSLLAADKSVLIDGDASPAARRGLTRRGWSIVERAAPPG